jgi:16S rRNA (guanine(966)-N(2))-methyltransferase RsmD
MRIIAGKYRGSKLNTLEGLKTRPTLDGTKEAIFSSLGGYIPGFVVLDIFGGSGALSLESLSRGAVKAYIIDNNIDAINIIKSNAAKLKVGNELVVYHAEYKNVLENVLTILTNHFFISIFSRRGPSREIPPSLFLPFAISSPPFLVGIKNHTCESE